MSLLLICAIALALVGVPLAIIALINVYAAWAVEKENY